MMFRRLTTEKERGDYDRGRVSGSGSQFAGESFVQSEPKVFAPFNGAWGRDGATKVHLETAKKSSLRTALVFAWRNRAPKRLVQEFDVE
ncbi:MAG TPA: hypothetical protein VNS63_09870 [Blastocatellia bacterium]|nr:hypothetical protein [Blastocatellia bacterium]